MGLASLLALALPNLSQADLFQAVSHRNASVPLPACGNGDSVAPMISADGRFVLFSSSANNLVFGDNSQLGLDVFLRDRASNTTVLLSANSSGSGGGNGNSIACQISTNGQYALFQSDASDLLPGDTNAASDIFVRDLQRGTNLLVSAAADGGWANGNSTDPVMTPDGRYVAFVSTATNLVAGNPNGLADVFVRDLIGGSTRLVSIGATGAVATVSAPVITPDGRYVAYFSTAHGLAAGVPTTSTGEVYVHDQVSNVTTWASTNASTVVSSILRLNNAPSYHPAISDDGRFVAFKTGWTNGATATFSSGAAAVIVFQYDASTRTTTILSTNGFAAWQQNDDVYGPEMSPDGRFVVFGETNRSAQCLTVQLWDALAGSNLDLSVAFDGSLPTNTVSDTPALTPDGQYVVFMSNATNLTGSVVSKGFHVYLRDVQAGTTQLIDVDTNGVGSSNPGTTIPGISADGRFVAFESYDGNLISGDNNQAFDVFVRDVTGGSTELISQSAPGLVPQTGDGLSSLSQFCLSDDGGKIVFTSCADDLVPNDLNGASDVFAFDVATGANILVSAGLDGNPAAGASFSPALARSGQLVAFVSSATNLVTGLSNLFVNVFLRDLQAGTTALVSIAPNGVTPGNGDASTPAISQDGRYLVFVSRASNLAPGASASSANAYLRDLELGTTTLLTNNASTNLTPSISADGRYVAYFGSGSQVLVRDTQLGRTIFVTNSAVSALVSPTGAELLYLHGTTLTVFNLLTQSNIFSIPANVPVHNPAPWSTDGRFLAFITATNAVPNDTNGTNDVYLCDVQAGAWNLVSINAAHTASANNYSDWPAVSGDGRFVIYRSFATDIVAANTNPPPNIFLYDRFTGSNTLLTSASPGSTWSSWSAKPMINGDGRIVAFQSWNPGLVPGDLNRVDDAFAGALSPWGATDSDGDGIPDLWMLHYFGHPTGQAADLSLAQDDADGDGLSNLEEFLAGTDPTNPASSLPLQVQPQVAATNTIILNWPAVPGKSYQVQFKTDLADPVWTEIPGVFVVGTEGSLAVPLDQASRFYRVTCE